MKQSNVLRSAIEEFELLQKNSDYAIILEFKKEMLALVNAFGNSGQSGGSAPFTAKAISQAIEKLCLYKPLLPLYGTDDEWNVIDNDLFYQNKRLSSVFKDDKNNKAYYIEAITFKSQNGSYFGSSSVELKDGSFVGSSQYIKGFPFKPKTFYIDVIETEWADKEQTEKKEGGGWWTSVVKDESQLIEVFEYYDRKIKKEL